MGEDMIYMAKKGMPRWFVVIIGAVIIMAVIMLSLPSLVLSGWLWAVIASTFGCAISFVIVDYYRSTRLVQGCVSDMPLSDLTKALYWLSAVNSGATSFSMGGLNYWQNVNKVAEKMGQEFQTRWNSIIQYYGMPNPKYQYVAIVLVFLAMLAMPTTLVIFRELHTWTIIALLAVALAGLALVGKQMQTIRLISLDPKAKETISFLIAELVSWVSAQTSRPIRVVLAGVTLPEIVSIDSLFGFAIAEIQPKSALGGHVESAPKEINLENEERQKEQIMKARDQQRLLNAFVHLAVAAVTAYLVFSGFGALLFREFDTFNLIATGMSLFLFVLLQYFLYTYLPMMKMLFRGGKASPFDFETLVKRLPKRTLKAACASDYDFGQKTSFLTKTLREGTTDLSTLDECVELWILEDFKGPAEFRYFEIEGDNVTLTENGHRLARTLADKLGKDHDWALALLEAESHPPKPIQLQSFQLAHMRVCLSRNLDAYLWTTFSRFLLWS
jgi:hypothetical protein